MLHPAILVPCVSHRMVTLPVVRSTPKLLRFTSNLPARSTDFRLRRLHLARVSNATSCTGAPCSGGGSYPLGLLQRWSEATWPPNRLGLPLIEGVTQCNSSRAVAPRWPRYTRPMVTQDILLGGIVRVQWDPDHDTSCSRWIGGRLSSRGRMERNSVSTLTYSLCK